MKSATARSVPTSRAAAERASPSAPCIAAEWAQSESTPGAARVQWRLVQRGPMAAHADSQPARRCRSSAIRHNR